MPSLIRFLIVIGVLVGLVCGGLYVLAVYFEPEQTEASDTVGGGIKIKP